MERSAPQQSPRIWRVGTLVYDRSALLNVFFWMLWGDFCLNLMDSGVTPTLVPLQLKKVGATDATIGSAASPSPSRSSPRRRASPSS